MLVQLGPSRNIISSVLSWKRLVRIFKALSPITRCRGLLALVWMHSLDQKLSKLIINEENNLFFIQNLLLNFYFIICRNLPAPLKKQKVEESTSEIPDVLQGEIARLDQRFKVSFSFSK